jgi:glucokinase
VADASIPTGRETVPDVLVRGVVDRVAALRENLGPGGRIAAIGVGCAGLINVDRGIVRLSPNLPTWRDVPLRDRLRDALQRPVSLVNDANAFAYAEGRYGAGAGCATGLFVTLGTGVGGAVVIAGKLQGGAHGLAGEIGHVSVDVDGVECPCGGRGCLEMLVGSSRIIERAERKIASGASGAAIRAATGDGEMTTRAIAMAAEAGDRTARAVFAEVGEIIGIALAGVSNFLDPDVIVIGGGVAEAGEVLWEPLRRTFDARVMAPADIRPQIRPSRFGASAGLIGAARFAYDRTTAA